MSRYFSCFACTRLCGEIPFPGNFLLQWSTIYYPGGRTKWKSLTKNPQVNIQQQGYVVWLRSVSKVSLSVLHLPLALHCWPHSSPSGKLPSPSEQWLITPGAQNRADTKFCHCHTTYVVLAVKLLFLPPHSHHIWQPAPNLSKEKPLSQDKASTLNRVTRGYFQSYGMGYSRWRTNKISQWLSGIWGHLYIKIEMK